jgi:hypothetical protein
MMHNYGVYRDRAYTCRGRVLLAVIPTPGIIAAFAGNLLRSQCNLLRSHTQSAEHFCVNRKT